MKKDFYLHHRQELLIDAFESWEISHQHRLSESWHPPLRRPCRLRTHPCQLQLLLQKCLKRMNTTYLVATLQTNFGLFQEKQIEDGQGSWFKRFSTIPILAIRSPLITCDLSTVSSSSLSDRVFCNVGSTCWQRKRWMMKFMNYCTTLVLFVYYKLWFFY